WARRETDRSHPAARSAVIARWRAFVRSRGVRASPLHRCDERQRRCCQPPCSASTGSFHPRRVLMSPLHPRVCAPFIVGFMTLASACGGDQQDGPASASANMTEGAPKKPDTAQSASRNTEPSLDQLIADKGISAANLAEFRDPKAALLIKF